VDGAGYALCRLGTNSLPLTFSYCAIATNPHPHPHPPNRIGDHGSLGSCRKACGKCRACGPGDMACYNENRRALGYLELTDVTPSSQWLF
jgi:hypothetical protein